MLRTTILLGLLAAAGCSSVDDYCARHAECYVKECERTDAACEAEAVGEEGSCNAELEADINATATGSNDICDDCNGAREAYYACASELEACSSFRDAHDTDGACYEQYQKMDTNCDNVRELCLE